MNDLLDISHRVLPVAVIGSGVRQPVEAYTDGRHFYFHDANIAMVGAHLTGTLDLSGRPVRVERSDDGWHERRGPDIRQLHKRHIGGERVFRFDEEWLFTVVPRPDEGEGVVMVDHPLGGPRRSAGPASASR